MLRVCGDFDPEPLLARVGWLEAADWWKKGDLSRRGIPHEASGVQIRVSDAGFDDLPGQVVDAFDFLSAELDAVRAVLGEAGVEGGVLDFGITQHDHAAYYRRFPANLVELAGRAGLGIEVSLYAVSGVDGSAGPEGQPDSDCG